MYDVDDAGIVTADNGDLDLGDTSAVTEDIELPVKGVNGSTIEWTSENPAITIQKTDTACTGKVTRPAMGQPTRRERLPQRSATVRQILTRNLM